MGGDFDGCQPSKSSQHILPGLAAFLAQFPPPNKDFPKLFEIENLRKWVLTQLRSEICQNNFI
jgi:hypothetical protein